MNERIRELKDQCWVEKRWGNGMWIEKHIDLELFAESILKDCIAMADDFECDVNQRGLVDRLKQHFGIEK